MAIAICEGIYEIDPNLILLALSNSEMITAAKETGLKSANEVFADRAYEEDGTLFARTKPGSMITDEDLAIQSVILMVEDGVVTSITGKEIAIQADSICVHGDGEKALVFTKRIRTALLAEGVLISAL